MAIKFQYNKTSLQQLEKQLKVRVRTLPIIKNKESALRMEVKRCKTEAAGLEERLEKQIQAYEAMFALWNEFDASLIKVSDVHLGIKKIAGVRVPLLENVDFDIRPYSLFNSPKWIVQLGSTKRNPGFAVGARRKWPLDSRRGGSRLRDVLRLMNHLGIIKEDFNVIRQTEISKAVYEEAPADGYWFPQVCAGQEVLKDALLGRWKSSDGTQNCEVRARFAGRVLYETTALGVRRNDPLVAYGTA